ncbi:inorganic phosphate transporter [Paracoccus sp. (in: a-proteobacteria)]|uniref:inorganic phosphate transporter n=1 Tax=Paracoccus sp. TaxID=267 RepID=UPI0026DF7A70|nr:inorganic phosphate transporter [Paracoccus sp. (in: a-proteobacteria)]MDO5647603.1 anion permease [Paracoccus sp. (in: a-proteobacteria)]
MHILDKDLGRITWAESAQRSAFRPVGRLGLGMLAIVGVLILTVGLLGGQTQAVMLGAGILVAAWLGVSIGANDVANSLGPAFGARAVGLGVGLVLVAVAEIAGAVLAGQSVTLRLTGLFDAARLVSGEQAQIVMLAALIGAASWITLATGIGLPVSTSHSIVGGIAGAGAVAVGLSGVAWATVARIALVWVATPIVAGGLAGLLVIFLRSRVIRAPDRWAAALFWLPGLVGVMCALFSAYLVVLIARPVMVPGIAALIGMVVGAAGFAVTRRSVMQQRVQTGKPAMRGLLRPALIVAVVMMGFAHGANDVANVAGPLSVILDGTLGGASALALLGAGVAIAAGTLIFGRRLVRMVGRGITRLNASRAFCVALATACTVLAASSFGWPVSTTHIAVGGVFGVGFAREWMDARDRRRHAPFPVEERCRRRLIRRSHVATITAAWTVTLPITAGFGAAVCALLLMIAG